MRLRFSRSLVLSGLVSLALVDPSFVDRTVASEPVDFGPLEARYLREVRPLLAARCNDCHATSDPQGELDLERFDSIASIRSAPHHWQRLVEMVADRQMPPADASPLSDDERATLLDWARDYLQAEARAGAGDPGPVVLRRLNNAEYTYTIRDLTGLPLDPAAEFPVDGAAGEGFANTGQALAMSPALFTKYLDAAKQVSSHVVLLEDGIAWSSGTTRRDFADERIAGIRQLYERYSDERGGVPWERYLDAAFAVRRAVPSSSANRDATDAVAFERAIAEQATSRGLSPRFLTHLIERLEADERSPLVDELRRIWRDSLDSSSERDAGAVAAIADRIRTWQSALVRFQNVGHLKPWQVDVDPITERIEIRRPLPAADPDGRIRIALSNGSAGDGTDGDVAIWERPRLVAAGRDELPIRDLAPTTARRTALRDGLIESTERALRAIATIDRSDEPFDSAQLAAAHHLRPELLAAWASVFGLGDDAQPMLDRFATTIGSAGGHDFVRGWGAHETPLALASSGDAEVRIPGRMKGHGVTVHPSPTHDVAIGWTSPIAGRVRLESIVTHAHPECGNGVVWAVEVRRGRTRRRLAEGVSHGGAPVGWNSTEAIAVRPGDLVSLLVGPRDRDHSCDLTDVEFRLIETEGDERVWNLTEEISPDILAGNPHADRFGHSGVWSFYREPSGGDSTAPLLPAGSTLSRWAEAPAEEREVLAATIAAQLSGREAVEPGSADAAAVAMLRSLAAPCYAAAERAAERLGIVLDERGATSIGDLPAERFGDEAGDRGVGEFDLVIGPTSDGLPGSLAIDLPADLAAGAELVATVSLHPSRGAAGSLQPTIDVRANGISPSDGAQTLVPGRPIVAGSGAERIRNAFAEFRRDFPAGLCYRPIVPVDEVVTLALFHREDRALSRLMLTDDEARRLDRLWSELHFVSRDALTMVDAFQQLMEYATQDSDPGLFEPFREPIRERAEAFRAELIAAEPVQLAATIDLAQRAFRRPLRDEERSELSGLYERLRSEAVEHDEAIRLLMVRILCSPSFLYRLEAPPEGTEPGPVDDYELASRLSYFLWSSMPDEALSADAAAGRLQDDESLKRIVARMLDDDRIRRMAIEFGCRYLQIHDFAAHDEKSERHFPEFAEIRDELYEEPIRFLTDLIRNDGSVMSLFDADHTFVNGELAAFYGIDGVQGDEWRRVDGVRASGRGGVLGWGATLAKNSGASRTSPILRGNWISEVILGEKLPKPPAGVPPLPDEDAGSDSLTVRQLIERHTSDPKCMGCHVRIDPMGFSLESFDAIGRLRNSDVGDRPLDTAATLMDGTSLVGLDGMRSYLVGPRGEQVERVFCRKLLGYALGRSVRLSDEPLLDAMMQRLSENGHRIHGAIELIVTSPQFREIRGRDFASVEGPGNE
ncbi:MAG TPA: DUF1592 domain-containing protein [Pirellulaceae bacterium]|nr:DUF1592 domain-containing protein [Pirellulaceae bacterium]